MGNQISQPITPQLPLFQRASFAAATAVTGFLLWKSMVPPRPLRTESAKDSISGKHLQKSFMGMAVYRSIIAGSAALNTITSFTGTPLNQVLGLRSAGHAGQIDSTFLAWNPVSAAVLATIASSATLRLYAMNELGINFTFDLHDPESLIKDGIYSYVQHPSYTTAYVAFIGGTAWFMRANGAVGEFIPLRVWDFAIRWQKLYHIFIAGMLIYGLSIRVRDEEKMLKEKFGKEWAEWNSNTPRFVPFMF